MSSPEKKKKRKTTMTKENPSLNPSPTPIPSLPDDLLLSCFARVSRLYYPTLSSVSKSFRSLIASPELYKIRSSLNHTESCLYVCLQFPPDPNPRWFTLYKKANQTLTNQTTKKRKKSSGYVLGRLPIPISPPAHWSGLVTIGSDIYNIGGCDYNSPSATVSILDCQSHTWRDAPSMRVSRNYPAANVLDGKIYVKAGREDCDSSNWMEVFDPNTQTWELVSSPGAAEICGGTIGKSATIDGKIYMFGGGIMNGLAYEPKETSWESIGWEMYLNWVWFSYCVVDNVLYCYSHGKFKWYSNEGYWRDLHGVEGLPKFARSACVKLADYGGKMAVLWDKFVPSSGYKDKMICCAVIALEKSNDGENIWGEEKSSGLMVCLQFLSRMNLCMFFPLPFRKNGEIFFS